MNMKREQPKGNKSLNRDDFRRFHRTGKIDIDPSGYDAFSRAALGGVRYQKDNPDPAFSRMEQRLGLQPSSGGIRTSMRLIMTAAASIAILISVGYIAFFQGTSVSGEEIYNTHLLTLSYVDGDLQRGTRTQGQTSNDLKEQAVQAYTAQDYDKAEALFQLYLSKTKNDPVARFYYGIVLLDQQKIKAATSIFEETRNNPPIPGLSRPSTYYLAMAHVRQEQHEMALPVLKSLTDKEDRYGRAAKAILSDYGL